MRETQRERERGEKRAEERIGRIHSRRTRKTRITLIRTELQMAYLDIFCVIFSIHTPVMNCESTSKRYRIFSVCVAIVEK